MQLNDTSQQNNLKKYATIASVSVSVSLCLIKAVAVFFTGSLSIMSSMIDSFADIFASLISFVAVKYSNKPLTHMHRYGYGKAEAVSALLQSAFITGSAGFILYDGINRLLHPEPINSSFVGIAIMIISLILTLMLIAFQKYVIKKTNSLAISADSQHYLVDLLTNATIILSLLVVHFVNWGWFDVLTAIIISLYLVYSAYHITYSALEEITDKEIDNDLREKIANICQNAEGIKGFHDLRSRISGTKIFIELHLEFDGNLSLFQTHQYTDKVEEQIIKEIPTAEIIIHQDPYGLHEHRLDHDISGNCEL